MNDCHEICDRCPFRVDCPPYLTPDTIRMVAKQLEEGKMFPCHKTRVFKEDGIEDDFHSDRKWCAGALAFMGKIEIPDVELHKTLDDILHACRNVKIDGVQKYLKMLRERGLIDEQGKPIEKKID